MDASPSAGEHRGGGALDGGAYAALRACLNEPMEAGSFRGVAGSAGQVRGTARLVLSLDDIDRLAPGETWSPTPRRRPGRRPSRSGGIVTDTGGALSHCAVVAREYGIPAVVGTRVATATVEDGQPITVDGTNGVVRIEG